LPGERHPVVLLPLLKDLIQNQTPPPYRPCQ
jgi:hypothetical protein